MCLADHSLGKSLSVRSGPVVVLITPPHAFEDASVAPPVSAAVK